MKLNKRDLKKIQYDYNKTCSWLLRSDYRDYLKSLNKFITFLKENSIIYDYIIDCGNCELNIEQEIINLLNSHRLFNINSLIGESDSDEVRNIFAILAYLASKDEHSLLRFIRQYSHSKSIQDSINEFNDRFVMIIINHIESYLTKIGIDMGIDEKTIYNVTVHNGQVNIANDSSVINANNNVGIDVDELHKLIENVRNNSAGLSEDDSKTLSDCLETIEIEASSPEPKKKLINVALAGLRGIKSSIEFSAAVATLSKFFL